MLVDPVYTIRESGTLALKCGGGSKQPELVEATDDEIIRRTELLRPYPNPFNPAVKFEFTLKESGKVRLSIYDIRGRLIQDIVNETLPTGRYERSWAGADKQGRRMASGVYFARMEADGQSWTHRMVLVK